MKYKILRESVMITSRGYDKDSEYSSSSIQFTVYLGNEKIDAFWSKQAAIAFINSKTVLGKKLLKDQKKLDKQKENLLNEVSKLTKTWLKLHNKLGSRIFQ